MDLINGQVLKIWNISISRDFLLIFSMPAGGQYKPEHAVNVLNRLKEVLSLRTLHKQLSQLLSVSEQTEMRMNKSFDPFDKLIPIQYSPYTGNALFWIMYPTM